MGIFGTGQAIRRREDYRFLTGHGRYTDDIVLEEQTHLYLFRSPFSHGKITELDVSHARDAAGVVCVLTADELHRLGVRDLPGSDFPKSALTDAKPALRQPPLARERVLYVGEPVVGIVAESRVQARDAAEMIVFDVDENDPIVTTDAALSEGAPQLHASAPGNSLGILEYGDRKATERAFANAANTVEIEVYNNRLAPTAMEPRACNADYDTATGQLTLYQGCQGVHTLRSHILKCFDFEPGDVHVVCPDVGGAFGLKFFLQCETVVAIAASMQIGRPVKWAADRSESFLADLHGRDQSAKASLAVDENGRFVGMKTAIVSNTGAYCSQFGPLVAWFGASMNTGCYDIPQTYVTIESVVTNTVPTDAYRGAGRPEAAYLIERLVDKAARELGISGIELRQRNFITPEQFPYTTATGRVYDSGNYDRLLQTALQRADWQGFDKRRRESAASGKLRGVGISYYVEICSTAGSETSHIRFEKNGRITVLVGTQASGQGHETSFAQMVADGLGVDFELVDIVQGDTRKIPNGFGTGGSRSMVMGGSSLFHTVRQVIENGKAVASSSLEAAVEDLEFDAGVYRIAGTDRGRSIQEVAAASYDDEQTRHGAAGLYAEASFTIDHGTFPNGCHICEVEIDTQTGYITLERYTIEDDVGTVVNPLILEGQIVGGLAQGVGQALGELALYDDAGQLLTATFLDYTMPRADWLPAIDFAYQEIASPANPLGIKGAGEAGTIGASPAVVNAILDALAAAGIRDVDMPVTPHKLWKLLQQAV